MYSKVRRVFKVTRKSFSRSETLSFLSQFVSPGNLVFDIGANVGDYTSLCLELGARVVAVEPQPDCVKSLISRCGQNSNLVVEITALGEHRGVGLLYLSDVRSPISSMSIDWIKTVKESGRFKRFEWRQTRTVKLERLEDLIKKYDLPDFCKIDVEGYDHEVLCGLDSPLGSLSFEYHIEFFSKLESCLLRLSELGVYTYNYTVGETPRLHLPSWVESSKLLDIFSKLPYRTLQGDIYAKLK
jgi:FkbM family methyltransferase